MKSRAGSGKPTQHSPGKQMYSELNNGRNATFVGEEDLTEHGSKMKQTTARFTEETWNILRNYSEEEDIPIAEAIRELTREGMIGVRKSEAFLLTVLDNLDEETDEDFSQHISKVREKIKTSQVSETLS